jgi:hypothetical protein
LEVEKWDMSDTTQGPDWWLASDAEWYPPRSAGQPPRPPPPEVVAAQKSVRTWGCMVPLGAVSLIVVGIAIAGIVRFAEISNQLSHAFDFHGFKDPLVVPPIRLPTQINNPRIVSQPPPAPTPSASEMPW